MKYPKRIILGIGGTHPDFLCACFRLMERGTKTKISSVGRVELKSKFKNETLDARLGGIKDLKLLGKEKNFLHKWNIYNHDASVVDRNQKIIQIIGTRFCPTKNYKKLSEMGTHLSVWTEHLPTLFFSDY